jgi:hypothetical protein
MTMPITFYQEMGIRDLNFEVANLESTDGVNSAQAATATFHKDWCDSAQKGLSGLLSSGRAQKQKRETAFQKYYEQGEPI